MALSPLLVQPLSFATSSWLMALRCTEMELNTLSKTDLSICNQHIFSDLQLLLLVIFRCQDGNLSKHSLNCFLHPIVMKKGVCSAYKDDSLFVCIIF